MQEPITISSDLYNQPLDELIATLKKTNELLEKIADRISWISGER